MKAFSEYDDICLSESSLTRVWQHFTNPDRTVVMFTAFRDERTRDDNLAMNRKFASELKSHKFGFFFINGFFPENEKTDDEVSVKEDSIFAIANGERQGAALIELAHKLANSANQDSILVKERTGNVYFLTKSGKQEDLRGSLKPGKLGKFYTQLRNKKKSNTFVFESIEDGKGFFQSMRENNKKK